MAEPQIDRAERDRIDTNMKLQGALTSIEQHQRVLAPRDLAVEHFPWDVPEAMQSAEPYLMLHAHGEYIATGGRTMDSVRLSKLHGWYATLLADDVVVEFDPSLPPRDEVGHTGGFAYRRRDIRDGRLIIRVNSHTRLTPEGASIWVLPPDYDN